MWTPSAFFARVLDTLSRAHKLRTFRSPLTSVRHFVLLLTHQRKISGGAGKHLSLGGDMSAGISSSLRIPSHRKMSTITLGTRHDRWRCTVSRAPYRPGPPGAVRTFEAVPDAARGRPEGTGRRIGALRRCTSCRGAPASSSICECSARYGRGNSRTRRGRGRRTAPPPARHFALTTSA